MKAATHFLAMTLAGTLLLSLGACNKSPKKPDPEEAPKNNELAIPEGVRYDPNDARSPRTLLERHNSGTWKLSVTYAKGCSRVEVRAPEAPFAELAPSRAANGEELLFEFAKGVIDKLPHILVIAEYEGVRIASPQARVWGR